MECKEVAGLADAFVDGELDAPRRAAVAAHLLGCMDCRRLVDETRTMVEAIRDQAPYSPAPAALAERIAAAAEAPAIALPPYVPDRRANARQRARQWSLAAAFLAVAVLSSVATYRFTVPAPGELLLDELVSGHVRSLMVDHLTDVASSDQHTVKPWFNGKLDLAPPVKDLTTRGFPLVGGRLDYVGGRPAAVLVYRHRQHVINLFIVPDNPQRPTTSAPMVRHGFNVLAWHEAGLQFWAVSDIAVEDLGKFRELVREADS
ncbi:MAG: anti-sigma factor [Alphaproteobacteria bacterium]|nr:anti-sigma factor [Alphaproteobacteria bacterium]